MIEHEYPLCQQLTTEEPIIKTALIAGSFNV